MTREEELKTLTDDELHRLKRTLEEASQAAHDCLTWSHVGRSADAELVQVRQEIYRRRSERMR